MSASATNVSLPVRIRAGWALGTCCTTFLLFLTNTFYLRFMTDFAGLSAAVAGGLLASMKLFEMVTAPAVGILTDHVPARFGRRRPFLLLGAGLSAIAIVAMFTVPSTLGEGMLPVYVMATLALGSLGYVIFNVPYLAMLAEMTDRPHERARLVSWRVYVLAGAQFVAGGIAPLLLAAWGSGRGAYAGMAATFGALILLAGVISFLGTRGARATAMSRRRDTRFFAQLPSLLRAPLYRRLLIVKATLLIGSSAHTVTATYYVRYILNASDATLSLFLFAYSGGIVLSQQLWLRVAARSGKVTAYVAAALLYTAISVIWSLMDWQVPLWTIVLLSLLNGAGAGGILMTSEALLPDAIEEDCARSGLRREGTLAAGFAFAEKAANAVGVALVGVLLSAFGYDAAARGGTIAAEQVRGIMLAFGAMPALFVGGSCLGWLRMRRIR